MSMHGDARRDRRRARCRRYALLRIGHQHVGDHDGANRRPLVTIAEQPQLAIDYVATFLGRLTREEARQYSDRYIGPYFNSVGRVDLGIAQRAVAAVATKLGVASPSADQRY